MQTLLVTKFHMPPPQGETVNRLHLVNKLSSTSKLSLICAPAGFGKTTFASSWLTQQGNPVAWLSLEENDNDIRRFCSYLFTSIDRVSPGIAEKSLELLQSSIQGIITTALTQLINDLAQEDHKLILALDDYHLIENQEIHTALSFLINHQPENLHLLITSRTEPPLPIAKLRAKYQLRELGVDDLRFNIEETAFFLNQSMGLKLSKEQVSKLEKQSEGWVTGLQLAALSLREQPEATTVFIDNLSGEDRHITDYLLGEVLMHQKQEIQDFLVGTSILKRMNSDLCNTLLGITCSQQILEQLEQDNLFITPLDNRRCWYRYHQLFAQMLGNSLAGRNEQELPRLHSRAATWLMANDMWEEGIDHALEAKDYDQVINYFETHIDRILAGGNFNMYLKWLGKIPKDQLPPILALHQLFFLHEMGSFKEFEDCLQRIELQFSTIVESSSEKSQEQLGILSAIKGVRSASFFAIDEAWTHFQKALNLLSEEQSFWLIMTLGGYGFCNRVRGNHLEAIQIFKQASAMAVKANLPFCFFLESIALAKLYMELGELEQATLTCQALVNFNNKDEKEVPFSGLAHVVMGQVYYHSGELLQAENHLSHGLDKIIKDGDVFSIVDGYLFLAQCLLALGKPEKAIEAMDEMSLLINALDPSQAVTIIANSSKALIQILRGHPELVRESFLKSDHQHLASKRYPDLFPLNFQGIYRTGQHSLTYYSKAIQLISAKLYIATNKVEDALALLRELENDLDEKNSPLFRAEILIQIALANNVLGHKEQALSSLWEVVGLIAPENYCQIFLREGRPMRTLLQQLYSGQGSKNLENARFITTLIENFSSPEEEMKRSSHSPFDLTQREKEVLNCLIHGATYKETAAQLFVSVNTLKTHIKRIYSKLGVDNRTQAINKAKECNLL